MDLPCSESASSTVKRPRLLTGSLVRNEQYVLSADSVGYVRSEAQHLSQHYSGYEEDPVNLTYTYERTQWILPTRRGNSIRSDVDGHVIVPSDILNSSTSPVSIPPSPILHVTTTFPSEKLDLQVLPMPYPVFKMKVLRIG